MTRQIVATSLVSLLAIGCGNPTGGGQGADSETQYLVFTLDHRDLQQTREWETVFARYKDRLSELQQGDKRKWGISIGIPSWGSPTRALKSHIKTMFQLAVQYEVAIHFTIESHEWEARPDLWNYSNQDEDGFDPNNANNVEWSDWGGTPYPYRFRDWGTPEKMPPVICYNSPTVLSAASQIIDEGIAPALVEGMEMLEAADRPSLFAGITVGAEPDLPNYENIDNTSPRIAQLMDSLGAEKTRLGYCALTNLGYSQEDPPPDFAGALAEVNRSYTAYWAKAFFEAGVPSSKMYTHVAAPAGVVGSPWVEMSNAPIDIAFIEHARPGWTTYPNGPLRDDFSLLYESLAEHDRSHWGGTEANPQGLTEEGISMDEYLDRHYKFGATLVVMNIGATDEELMERLSQSLWNEEAIEAYKAFLEDERLMK